MENLNKIDLSKKINEDLILLNNIEKELSFKKWHVIQLPQNWSNVWICISWWLDSIALLFMIANEYNYNIYPIFFNRWQKNYIQEKKSAEYHIKLLKDKYKINELFEIEIDIPSKSYKANLTTELQINNIWYPARNSVLWLIAAEYFYSLESKWIKIRTIFWWNTASDSLYHSSLTWHRILNLLICQSFNDYSWQFISIPIENSLLYSFWKNELINYCYDNNFSLSKTRTCVWNTELQCWKCVFCLDRKNAYANSRYNDDTIYN